MNTENSDIEQKLLNNFYTAMSEHVERFTELTAGYTPRYFDNFILFIKNIDDKCKSFLIDIENIIEKVKQNDTVYESVDNHKIFKNSYYQESLF
jgi:hypothetical protein